MAEETKKITTQDVSSSREATKKREKKRAPRQSRRKQEQGDGLEDSVLEIRRVTRVVAGGKRFSFRATVVVGDKNGKVGIGKGKGLDVSDSIRKGRDNAVKNMIEVKLKDSRTVPYDIEAKYGASRVLIKPTSEGHGLIAGGAVRVVLDLVGVKDISAKILGSTNNKLNNAMATITALKNFEKQ